MYSDVAALVEDGEWQRRMIACSVEQARVFTNDARPEFKLLADAIIADASEALGMRWLVASAPVVGDQADDPVLLDAVQNSWPIYGATLAGAAPASDTLKGYVDERVAPLTELLADIQRIITVLQTPGG
jgi:hypothetical protein